MTARLNIISNIEQKVRDTSPFAAIIDRGLRLWRTTVLSVMKTRAMLKRK